MSKKHPTSFHPLACKHRGAHCLFHSTPYLFSLSFDVYSLVGAVALAAVTAESRISPSAISVLWPTSSYRMAARCTFSLSRPPPDSSALLLLLLTCHRIHQLHLLASSPASGLSERMPHWGFLSCCERVAGCMQQAVSVPRSWLFASNHITVA